MHKFLEETEEQGESLLIRTNRVRLLIHRDEEWLTNKIHGLKQIYTKIDLGWIGVNSQA